LGYSAPEVEYLKSQRLARIATVSKNGELDVVPVGFEFDGHYFYVGSHSQEIFLRTRKYKSVRDGSTRVGLVIDDLESVEPWKPRGIKIIGTAEIVERRGMFGSGKYLRITPRVSWSWGISGLKVNEGKWSRKTVHSA
jgi:pyridoxamine 5'-phosphate oxidase family protein